MLNNNEQNYFLLYDDQCSLCVRFQQGLQYLDTQNLITFLSVHDVKTYEMFPDLKKEDCLSDLHFIANGQIFIGPNIVAEVAKIIPSVSKLAWLLESNAGQKASELFYKQLNRLKNSHLNPCRSCRNH